MHPKLFAQLHETIVKFLNDAAEAKEWNSSVYIHDNLALHMTQAAQAVFNATVESSIYTQDNK